MTITLFYIGEEFYDLSDTRMSNLYETRTKVRWDYSKLEKALAEVITLVIRRANTDELKWA